jgi:hypothetical protein
MKKLANIFIVVVVVAVAWWFVRRVLRPIMRFAANVILTAFVVIGIFIVIAILKNKNKGGR